METLKKIAKLIAIDQITKILMSFFSNIVFIKNVLEFDCWGNIKITLVNTWFLILLIAVIGVLIIVFKSDVKIKLGLIFTLSGALSNFLDLVFRGFVVDWIRFFTLVFNLADIFIILGILIVIQSLTLSFNGEEIS